MDTSSRKLLNVSLYQKLKCNSASLSFEAGERGFGISSAQTVHVFGMTKENSISRNCCYLAFLSLWDKLVYFVLFASGRLLIMGI